MRRVVVLHRPSFCNIELRRRTWCHVRLAMLQVEMMVPKGEEGEAPYRALSARNLPASRIMPRSLRACLASPNLASVTFRPAWLDLAPPRLASLDLAPRRSASPRLASLDLAPPLPLLLVIRSALATHAVERTHPLRTLQWKAQVVRPRIATPCAARGSLEGSPCTGSIMLGALLRAPHIFVVVVHFQSLPPLQWRPLVRAECVCV